MSMQTIASIIVLIFGIAICTGIIYGIYCLVKHLIHYNAECQDQYARKWKAEQDIESIEAELNCMKDHDWSRDNP